MSLTEPRTHWPLEVLNALAAEGAAPYASSAARASKACPAGAAQAAQLNAHKALHTQ